MILHLDIDEALLLVALAFAFLHAGDFTPVCTTELGMMAAQAEEFSRRGVKLIGLSCDDVQSHTEWIKDIEAYNVSFWIPYRLLLVFE